MRDEGYFRAALTIPASGALRALNVGAHYTFHHTERDTAPCFSVQPNGGIPNDLTAVLLCSHITACGMTAVSLHRAARNAINIANNRLQADTGEPRRGFSISLTQHTIIIAQDGCAKTEFIVRFERLT